ncbi:MAG: CHAD domain-containing protein [Acetobacteraceae bacterium]
MRMELACHPDDAVRLSRMPAFAPLRQGRTVSRRCKLLWHDEPEHTLTARGLVLAEHGGTWSLERHHPGPNAWPPAAPPPVVAEAIERDALAEDAHPTAEPFARFEGRDALHPLSVDGAAVTMTIRRGTLYVGTTTAPACRILLDGAEPAVLHVALAVAMAVRVEVPRASLSAEAIALRDGTPPAPRRLGAPTLPADHEEPGTIGGAFRHTLGHLTDVLLHHAPLALHAHHGTEPVHQARVAVRRARSALSLFRAGLAHPMLDRASGGLKDLGSRLGPSRDWDVFVTETAPAVQACFPEDMRLQRLMTAAEHRRRDCHTLLHAYLTSPDFRALGVELAWLAGSTGWIHEARGADATDPTLSTFAAGVMRRRLRKLRGAGKNIATLDVPALHNLRLRAKRTRYAAEVFVPLYPGKASDRFVRRLSRLQQALGVLNDGAVAADLMTELGGPAGRHGYAIGLVLGFIAARGGEIRPAVLAAWEKFRRVAPFWA